MASAEITVNLSDLPEIRALIDETQQLRQECDRLRAVVDAARAVTADGWHDLSDCPYYRRGLPGEDPLGTCSHGCREEPACHTDIPRDGWPIENLRVALAAWDTGQA